MNGPAFHTGQAIRALLVAARRLKADRYGDAAKFGAEFLLRERITRKGIHIGACSSRWSRTTTR